MRFLSCRPQSSYDLNRFFDDDLLARMAAENPWSMALDVVEEKERYVLKADLPGVKKEDIKVSLEDNILTVEAKREAEAESQEKQVHRIERTYGRYQRSLNLGAHVDASRIKANYKDGVLELIVPKSEAAKPKSIDVHVD